MKTKELKNIANKIAKCEKTLRDSTDSYEIRMAQEEIMNLSGKVESLEDIEKIDEMVQTILSK